MDAAGRPARGRRRLADLRLAAARGGARAARTPAASRHRDLASPGRVPLGAALRRLPRRHVRAREPRRAQPHAPRRAHRADAARARLSRRRSSSSSRRRRGSSSRVIASGWRWRGRTGRTRGRRRKAAPSRWLAATVELELPVLAGPPVAPAPASRHLLRRPGRTPRSRTESEPAPAVRRSIERDAVGRQTRVVTGYGSSYERAVRRNDRRALRRRSSASLRATRVARGRRARARYDIEWPETTVSTEAHLRFRSTATRVPRRRRGDRGGGRRLTASATSSAASSARSRAGCSSDD